MRSIQYSFGAGEIAPEMRARIDTAQYPSGAATMLNFLPLPRGVAQRRSGFRHVNTAYQADKASRLLPFVFSSDQAVAVEMSEAVLRFHSNGDTARWSQQIIVGPLDADSITVDSPGVIKFENPHGLNDGEAIRVISDGTYPGGLNGVQVYDAQVVDHYRVTLEISAVPVNITTIGSGYMVAFRAVEYPQDFIAESVLLSGSGTEWNVGASSIDYPLNPFADGNTIVFTGVSNTTIPLNVISGTIYLVINSASSSFQIATVDDPSTPITLTGAAAGSSDIRRHYVQGELFNHWVGSPLGVHYTKAAHDAGATIDLASVYLQTGDGILTVPSPYLEGDVFGVKYAQSNDIMTLTHPSRAPMELRRYGASNWTLVPIAFGSTIGPPTGLTATETRGVNISFTQVFVGPGSIAHFEFETEHNLAQGDAIYVENIAGAGSSTLPTDTSYIVNYSVNNREVSLRRENGSVVLNGIGNVSLTGQAYYASLSAENAQSYRVTSMDSSGVESTASDSASATNNLDVSGSSNAIAWFEVTGAEKYRVYKLQNGVYGYIGESDTGTFLDDGIASGIDLGRTPPIQDTDLSGTDYPRATGYFEQRRCFAGSVLKPRQLWMTKSGTESDLTYSIPIKDDDRISVALAAREAATIRHIVPVSDLVLLSQEGEWGVTSINSDAITPETIAVRQFSSVGASDVRPVVVSNVIVFCANRGGHVYELSYSFEAQRYRPVDRSLRASHLFDGETILDVTFSKAPYPVVWYASSSGKLLSLTFVPEEGVSAWAQHNAVGTFESVCSLPEGQSDVLYAVMRRTINGSVVRHIERMIPDISDTRKTGVYMDGAVTYDGTAAAGNTVTVTGGVLWKSGETVTITATDHFLMGREDVSDAIDLRDGIGGEYRVLITGYVDSKTCIGRLEVDLPLALRSVAVAPWALARRRISGLGHMEGQTVVIVRDGVVEDSQVVTFDAIVLSTPGAIVNVGMGYTSDLQTLPAVFGQIEAAGQGRTKNVSHAHANVLDASGLRIGPTEDLLEPMEDMSTTDLTTGEVRSTLRPAWTKTGQVFIRQTEPLPATVIGLTLEMALGD